MQAIFSLMLIVSAIACQPGSQQNQPASQHSELSSDADVPVKLPANPVLPQEPEPSMEASLEPKTNELNTAAPTDLDQDHMQTAAAGNVTVSSSCGFTGFRIQLKSGADTQTSAVQSFANCDKVATKINGLVLPTGKTTEALKGGRSIQASCDLEQFSLTVTGEGTSSAIAMNTTQEKVCLELRNAINGLKL